MLGGILLLDPSLLCNGGTGPAPSTPSTDVVWKGKAPLSHIWTLPEISLVKFPVVKSGSSTQQTHTHADVEVTFYKVCVCVCVCVLTTFSPISPAGSLRALMLFSSYLSLCWDAFATHTSHISRKWMKYARWLSRTNECLYELFSLLF